MASSTCFSLLALLLICITLASAELDLERRVHDPVCKPSGKLRLPASFKHKCEECCKPRASYLQFDCSPPVSKKTPATLTVNSFQKGGDGGGASACDGKFHSDKDKVVALSTGWFDKKRRCGSSIVISANGRTVVAKVVDECDSAKGCDAEHGFQPPCPPNVVDASPAVWKALGVPSDSDTFGWMDVTWTDAPKIPRH